MNEKHKLVPVEPTPEMLEAGAGWCGQGLGTYEAKGRAATAYKFMLAAAPAVQVEPVGYVSPRLLDALRSGKACGITMEDKPDAHNGVTIPLYTAPQPVEQMPAPDVTQLVEALERAHMALIGYPPGHRNDITDAAISQCEQALAAYRKKGGKP